MDTGTALNPWSSLRRRSGKVLHKQNCVQVWDAALKHARIPWRADDRVVLLYGHPAASRLALAEAGYWAIAGEPVVYVDGDQSFDPLLISRLAKSRRLAPRKVLGLIHTARVFSGVQMERLTGSCLAGALDRYQSRRAVVAGEFDMLTDEQIPERERIRTADRVLESIRELSRCNFTILCPCPVPSASGPALRLLDGLRGSAQRIIRIHDEEGNLSLDDQTGASLWESVDLLAAAH